MKFKNYRNSYNRRNRIFSEEDLWNMRLSKLFDNENDILAQNNQIGIPTSAELENSQNTRWVVPEVKGDETEDDGFWESILENPIQKADYAGNNLADAGNENKNNSYTVNLEGGVKRNNYLSALTEFADEVKNVKDKVYAVSQKYQGMYPELAVQEALTRIWPTDLSEQKYYDHSFRLSDGEEPSDFMKEHNYLYKLDDVKDSELKQLLTEQAVKMRGINPADPDVNNKIGDVDVVIPKEGSQLYSQVKNSKIFKEWVSEYIKNLEDEKKSENSIEFPKAIKNTNAERSLYATIKRADMKNTKLNEDGSLSTILSDIYDFDERTDTDYTWNYIVQRLNNNAAKQQDLNKLKKYLLTFPLHLSKEEIEEIIEEYKNKN